MTSTLTGLVDHVDVLIHSVAFAPEIKSKLVDTTRAGYWTALSISATR